MRALAPTCRLWAFVILTAGAGCGSEVPGPNRSPVAVAGPDRTTEVGTPVLLDGASSWDPDGDTVACSWHLVAAAAYADLIRVSDTAVELTPLLPGGYALRLEVEDGRGGVSSDGVVVHARGQAPACSTDADCDDDNPCTDDLCGPENTCDWIPNTAPCDDGLYCTSDDTCDGAGRCTGGGSPCTAECLADCNEQTDTCEPVPDGTECGQRTCQDMALLRRTCQAGACNQPELLEHCDDGNECTADSCDPAQGCDNTGLGDGSPCAGGSGICCEGTCWAGWECCSDADCIRDRGCIGGSCEQGHCSGDPVTAGTPCDGGDGNLCNSTCDDAGNCTATAVACDDAEPCNGLEGCDPATGACLAGTPPGPGTHCIGDDLVTCNTDGQTVSVQECPLGCNAQADPQRCHRLDPSNLPPALLCVNGYDLVVDSDVVIDTDAGTITGVWDGYIHHTVVSQGADAPAIGAFSFNSLTIDPGVSVTVTGHNALALLACTRLDLAGTIDAGGTGTGGGAGGYDGGASGEDGYGPCPGAAAADGTTTCPAYCASGGGGAGHVAAGGDGGPVGCSMDGELVQRDPGTGGGICGTAGLVPLAGGSGGAGGTPVPGVDSSAPGSGGGGGGAVQLVAGTVLSIGTGGGVDAGAEGGGPTVSGGGAGGGAGGAILLEAPAVEIHTGTFLAANGGGGGGGDCG